MERSLLSILYAIKGKSHWMGHVPGLQRATETCGCSNHWIILTGLKACLFKWITGHGADAVRNSATEEICYHLFGFLCQSGIFLVYHHFVILKPFQREILGLLGKNSINGWIVRGLTWEYVDLQV